MFQGDCYLYACVFLFLNPEEEPIGCPETSVRNYNYWLRNDPEERSSLHLYVYPHLYRHIIKESKYKLLQCRNRENVLCNYRLLFGC